MLEQVLDVDVWFYAGHAVDVDMLTEVFVVDFGVKFLSVCKGGTQFAV